MAPRRRREAANHAPTAIGSLGGQLTRAEQKAVNRKNFVEARAAEQKILEETKANARKAAAAMPAAVALVQATKNARPWEYARVEWSDTLAEQLFMLIATGHTMEEIANLPNMPSMGQQLSWLADEQHPFVVLRERAKKLLVPLYEEKATQIAVHANPLVLRTRKQVVTRDGDIVWVTEKREIDNVARSALTLSGLQWTLGHLLPRKHGRNPDTSDSKPNEQLEGLFAALKAGPAE